jgi:hypothetical protein
MDAVFVEYDAGNSGFDDALIAYDIWSGAWEGFYLDKPIDKKSGRLDSFFKLNGNVG